MDQDHKQECQRQLFRLINKFGAKSIISMIPDVTSMATLRSWRVRGRISATAAHELCKLPEVRQAGFTREILRPDVQLWWKAADE